MPIKIPNALPAAKTLTEENIFIMTETRAISQDIRPLKILILNLMPTKIDTETQLVRLIGNTPLQVEVELIHTASHQSKNTSEEHLLSFYKTFDQVKHQKFDGMIITGAPVEMLDYEEVEYWQELCEIFEWTKTHVHSTFHICWGAQAGLYYHFGIKKKILPAKVFGVFKHTVDYKHPILFRGADDVFYAPHSRHSGIDTKDIETCDKLKILAGGEDVGIYACMTQNGKQIFITGHSEYDPDTLAKEYFRDKAKGMDIAVPKNYFPNDDDTQKPVVTWRAHANLLYSNWLNYFVYQTTPYDLSEEL